MISRFLNSAWTLVFIFFAYVLGISNLSVPLTGDQKVYLSIALEMRERSSILIPYLAGAVNFLKPPFQYWMTLIGWKVFGLSLVGALLPSVLALLTSAYWVKRISKSRSYLPALYFSSTLGTLTYGTTAQMEIWIVLFYLSAWGLWLEKKIWLSFIVVGIMSLIKGPLYPALWVLSVIFFQVLEKDWKRIFKSNFLLPLGVAVGLGLSWYGAVASRYPHEIIDVFFKKENLGKFQTAQGSMLGMWGGFLFSLFPILFWMIAQVSDSEFRARNRANKNFYFAYCIFPALFFTLFPYRVNSYLYLLTPIAVLFIPNEASTFRFNRSLNYGYLGFLFLLTTILCFFDFRLLQSQWIGLEIALPLLVVLMVWFYGHLKWNANAIGVSALLMVTLIRLGAIEIGEWDLSGLRDWPDLQTKPIAYYLEGEDIWHEYGLVSSAVGKEIQRISEVNTLKDFLQSGGGVIFEENPSISIQGLHCTDWIRIKRRIKFPIKELLIHGLSRNDPNLHRTYHLCSF